MSLKSYVLLLAFSFINCSNYQFSDKLDNTKYYSYSCDISECGLFPTQERCNQNESIQNVKCEFDRAFGCSWTFKCIK